MKSATRPIPNPIGFALGGFALVSYCGWNLWWLAQGRLPASIALAVFNVPAPSTGFTRSVLALAEGDVMQSLWWNPISIPLLFLTAHGLYRLVQLMRGRGSALERRWLYGWAAVLGAGWFWKLWQGPVAW